jgi:ASC-1-like (ASCH) protein
MTHELIIFEPWFSHVKTNKKKLEARRGTREMFEDIKKLKFIRGEKDKNSIKTRSKCFYKNILRLYWYPDLENMLIDQDLTLLLPTITTKEEALDIFHSFWTDELIAKTGGIVVWELE